MYAKKTLTDLQQGVADRHDSGVLPTSSVTLAFWTRLLNRGQAYCSDRLGLTTSTDLTTVSGTIALPDDFIKFVKVLDSDGNEQKLISKEDSKSDNLADVYWITGNHTDGFYLNSPDDETLTVYYNYRPAPLVNSTDVCVIPDPEAVVAFAYGMLRKSETDPIEDADESIAECDSRLAEVQSAELMNDNFEGFKIQDYA